VVVAVTRELWLVRHGETKWNAAGRFCGRSDPPLTERGRSQARELRPALRNREFDSCLSSPSVRSVETARLAYGEPALDARLHELDFGDIEGVTWTECSDDLRRKLADYEAFAAPNGESVAQLSDRVTELLDELGAGRHLVFTHGGVIRLLLGRAGETGFPGLGTISKVVV
jgi:probable phosphoglycerate mutase